MIRQIDDPPALRMPSAGSFQAANSGEIGIVRNPQEFHVAGLGKDSVIDPFEHFTNDGGAKFVA
jgi:hypothetical protein